MRITYGAVVYAAISNREVAGSIPADYGHTHTHTHTHTHIYLSSLSQTPPDLSYILRGGYQQPVHAGVCGVMCAGKNEKTKKVGIHWPEKPLHSCVV